MNTTKLYVKEDPSRQLRLMNTIDSSSRFHTVSRTRETAANPSPQDTHEDQMRIARELAGGWRANGPWPKAEYIVEQYDRNGKLVKTVAV